MNLSTEAKDKIKYSLSKGAIGQLLPLLEVAKLTCDGFFANNKEFFDAGEYLNNLRGELLSYSLSREIKHSCEKATFPFVLHNERINNFGYTIPVLSKDGVSLSFMRSLKRYTLGRPAREYLKQKNIGNEILNPQLELFEQYTVKDHHLHGLVLYGLETKEDVIDFADILFWNEKQNKFYYKIDLKEQLKIYEQTMSEQEKEEVLLRADDLKIEVGKKFELNI